MRKKSTKKEISQSVLKIFCGFVVSFGLLSSPALSAFPAPSSAESSTQSSQELMKYPFILIQENVTTASAKHAHRAQVMPGEVITVRARITNYDPIERENAVYQTFLGSDMAYIPGSLHVNGKAADPTLTQEEWGGTNLSVPDLTLKAHRESGDPIKIAFQVKVLASDPDQKEVSIMHLSNVTWKGDVEFGATSNPIFLFSKENAMPNAYYEVVQQVGKKAGKKHKIVSIQPGDTLYFNVKLKNLGDLEGNGSFRSYLPEGLSYVPGSFKVDAQCQEEVSYSTNENYLTWCGNVAAFKAKGSVVSISFQAKVTDAISNTGLYHSSSFTPMSEPFHQYVALSNPVKLVVE